ncbi:MAG: hypothetical protein ACOYMM_10370 [Phycisphaerales bacterium]
MEEAEARQVGPGAFEERGACEDRVDLRGGRRGVGRDPAARAGPEVRQDRDASFRDLAIAPAGHDVGPDRQEKMEVVPHHCEGNDIDRHPVGEEAEPVDDPRAARGIVEQRLPPHAARDAVIDAGAAGIDDVTSATGHGENVTVGRGATRNRTICF